MTAKKTDAEKAATAKIAADKKAADKKAADEKAANKKKRRNLPPYQRSLARMVRANKTLIDIQSDITKWASNEAEGDEQDSLIATSEACARAIDNLTDAHGAFASLPEDFKPTAGSRHSALIGATVVICESKRSLYVGMFDEMDTELTAMNLIGSRRVLCLDEDTGARAVFPVAHVEVVSAAPESE